MTKQQLPAKAPMATRRQVLSGALGAPLLLAGAAAPAAAGESQRAALNRISEKARRSWAPRPLPILATPGQLFAEQLSLKVLREPALQAAYAESLSQLRRHPNAQSRDGQARLERTVTLWALQLIGQTIGDHISPAFLIYADDTPHRWFGYEFPGIGISGDNPDNTYRVAQLDGARRYEVRGRMPAPGPAQMTVDLGAAMTGGGNTGSNTTDLGGQIKLFRDDDLQIDANGEFLITVGPSDGPGNHMNSRPGRLALWVRESRSDWRQPPVRLSIRMLDDEGERPAPNASEIATVVAAQLVEWNNRWAGFRMTYLGRPPVNTVTAPIARDGGFGYLAGGRFELEPDEAIVAVTQPQGARYTGMQLTDPWGITLDARKATSARNNSQTMLNPDGSATYVICERDPGVPNWIALAGLTRGEVRFRWQKLPASHDPARFVRSYRKIAFGDMSRELPAAVGRVSASARAAELARRAQDYDTRWTL